MIMLGIVWGVLCALLLLLTTNILEQIITKPIVQTSRESNVPGWMSVPTIGCITTGSVFLFSPSSALVSGSSCVMTHGLGWLGFLFFIPYETHLS